MTTAHRLNGKLNVLLALLFPLFTSHQASAQNEGLEDLLLNRQVSCADISLNSSEYIPYYLNNNLMDSALIVLDYWGEKCGNSEPAMRANILIALDLFYFDEEMITDDFLRRMFIFSDRVKLINENNTFAYNYHQSDFDFVPAGGVFDMWTLDFATRLLEKYEPETLGYFLALFYSGATDGALNLLGTYPYNEFKPGIQYNALIEHYQGLPSTSISGFAGTWIPMGPLEAMGVHPEIGMTYGIKKKENLYELVMGVKFVKTPESYLTRRNKDSEWEYSNDFSGVYLGFEYSRDLMPQKRNSPFFSIGAAYDAITTLNEDTDNNLKAATAGSYNFNLGGGVRIFLNNRSYLGLQLRYNVVDYSLSQVFNKQGHVITARLSYGVFQNNYREERLEYLKYAKSK